MFHSLIYTIHNDTCLSTHSPRYGNHIGCTVKSLYYLCIYILSDDIILFGIQIECFFFWVTEINDVRVGTYLPNFVSFMYF